MMNEIVGIFSTITGLILVVLSYTIPRIVIGGQLDKRFYQKFSILTIIVIYFISIEINFSLRGVWIILFYYIFIFFRLKKTAILSLFYALYMFLAFDTIYFFSKEVFYRTFNTVNGNILFVGSIELFLSLCCLGVALLVLGRMRLDKSLLESKSFEIYIKQIIPIFFWLSVLAIVSSFLLRAKNPFYERFDTTVSLFMFLVYILSLLYLRDKQIVYYHQEHIEQSKKENYTLHKLVLELGYLYDKIRGFRHDFGGIIASLEPAIEKEDIQEIKEVYEGVFLKMNQELRKTDYTTFNLTLIEGVALKNVLAQKLIQAKAQNIPFSLEINSPIPELNIPMLETVRLMTILLDNALEGAEKAVMPKVNVALSCVDNITHIIIQNTREELFLNLEKIWKRGYSTKGVDRGLGLTTLSEIISNLNNVEIETEIQKTTFTQILSVKNSTLMGASNG